MNPAVWTLLDKEIKHKKGVIKHEVKLRVTVTTMMLIIFISLHILKWLLSLPLQKFANNTPLYIFVQLYLHLMLHVQVTVSLLLLLQQLFIFLNKKLYK